LVKRKKSLSLRRENQRIALERISVLFELAREVFVKEPVLAQRYVDLARKIGMHYKVRLPAEYRRMICRHCKSFILPGINCRVRIQQRRSPHLVVTCLNCGGHMRIPIGAKS
jgi:ribonuclease P protein subunit RPR2